MTRIIDDIAAGSAFISPPTRADLGGRKPRAWTSGTARLQQVAKTPADNMCYQLVAEHGAGSRNAGQGGPGQACDTPGNARSQGIPVTYRTYTPSMFPLVYFHLATTTVTVKKIC